MNDTMGKTTRINNENRSVICTIFQSWHWQKCKIL